MLLTADLHVHSDNSKDGTDSINDICREAVKKNFKYICFTEHLDLGKISGGTGFFNFKAFSKEIDRARNAFGGELTVLKGAEVGEPHLYRAEFEKILKLDFDMILGSVHWIGNHFAGENDLELLYSKDQIFEMYYIELLKAVESGGFDAVAHFDFPKRYLGKTQTPGIVEEILRIMIKNGIALELNTSSMRKGLEEPLPGAEILDKYANSGGRMITTGSDAHNLAEIGSKFNFLETLLDKNGIVAPGYFENRVFKNFR